MGKTENALDHRFRKLIFKYISANPGVAIAHLSTFLNMNYSTLKYHLKYLERNKIINSRKEGRNRCFYINDTTWTDDYNDNTTNPNLLNQNQQMVLRIIQNYPGISKKKLKTFSKLNRKTLTYSINRLFEMRLIWKVTRPEGEGFEFITEEKLRYEILNQLLQKLLSNQINEETFQALKTKLEGMSFVELRGEYAILEK
jgi:predicted transcriptional regulator